MRTAFIKMSICVPRACLCAAFVFGFYLLLACPKLSAAAEEKADKGEEPPPLSNALGFDYYYSPAAGVKRNGAKTGDVSIQRAQFDYRADYDLSDTLRVQAGVYASYMGLGVDEGIPLPTNLQMAGITLGATQNLSDALAPGWGTFALVRPMLTSDVADFSEPGFVFQGVWAMTYKQNERLWWVLGLMGTTHAENYILPLAGVRWQFADDWTATLGFPETAVAWRLNEDLTLKFMVIGNQSSYRTHTVQVNGQQDTYLEFREIRMGVGADYKILPNLTVGALAGGVLYRRFNYFDAGYELEGQPGGFFSINLRLRF